MHSLFTPVETLDGSTFLRSVHSADGTTIKENFIMPINGFTDSNGDPVTITGLWEGIQPVPDHRCPNRQRPVPRLERHVVG